MNTCELKTDHFNNAELISMNSFINTPNCMLYNCNTHCHFVKCFRF